MSRLPEDIIEENILTRLPVKSIARFRCVSTKWRLLFQNPNFIKNHLNHAIQMNKFNILVRNRKDSNNLDVVSSASLAFSGHAVKIDYPFMPRECSIIGSCYGLVCINSFSATGICFNSPFSAAGICIWNPATREYKQVPRFPKPSCSPLQYKAYGFGYDCKNDDYVLLRIVGFEEVSEVTLYSLRSNSWKNLGVIPVGVIPIGVTKGVFHNGVLYWIAAGLKSRVILCFDISDQTFHHVPLPNNISDADWKRSMPDLGIWEGKLCLLHTKHMEDVNMCTHQNDHVDVWTMIGSKWCKHLKITAQIAYMYYRRPIQTLPNGEILFEGGPMEKHGTGLISYDSKLERATALKIHGFPDEYHHVVTYIETLAALNSGSYVGQ